MNASSPRIVVLGSINMDLVIRCAHLPTPGETIIAESCQELPGGKGANQAVAASRSGGKVTMIGRVGADAFAARLIENLRRESVNCDPVLATQNCASGVAVVAVDDRGENSIMVVPGANATLTPGDVAAIAAIIRDADLLLLQLEVPLETVAAAIRAARQAGTQVILNPAPMPPRLPPELNRVDVLCPNQSEASAMIGQKIQSVDDALDAAPRIRSLGAENVLITLGSAGVVVADSSGSHRIDPFPVTAVDTTAAGDAFAGALAVRWAMGDALTPAARFAAAAGALAATRRGAQIGMPERREIEAFVNESRS